jgi:hypothetical protein
VLSRNTRFTVVPFNRVITKLGIYGQKIIDFDGTRHGSVLAKDWGRHGKGSSEHASETKTKSAKKIKVVL